MIEIAILTPDSAEPSYASQWPGALERLSATLAEAGVTAVPMAWTDHIDSAAGLTRFPLVLPLLVWGYHRDHDQWLKACEGWDAAGVRMLNPPSVLGWNSDKSYLGRLADKGVAMPDTVWVDSPTQGDVDAAFDRFGTDRIVVKPRVSAGAHLTQRLAPGEPLIDAPEGPAMIQPDLPTIETEGETSLLFFDGRLSHAVNKRPVDGDFRIQSQFGGLYVPVTPPEAAQALAHKVLAAIDEPLLYARIDMAPDPAGNWLLMEAELIEPDIYLTDDPARGAGFAAAVRARLG